LPITRLQTHKFQRLFALIARLRGHLRVTKARRLVADTVLAARRSDDVRRLLISARTMHRKERLRDEQGA
jgi:hypothetical protein